MQLRRHFESREWLAPLLAALAGMALSLMLADYFSQRGREGAYAEFQQISEKLVQTLERRLDSYLYGLRGLHTLLLVRNGQLTRADFGHFLADRDLADEFPGVLGFGFIQRLPARPSSPDASSAERYVVEIAEPFEGNSAWLGMDLATDPVQRAALLTAMRSGYAVLSQPVRLVQDARGERGLLYLQPYYAPGMPLSSVGDREAALVGWVGAAIAIAPLMADLQQPVDKLFDYELYAGFSADPVSLLYDSDTKKTAGEREVIGDMPVRRPFVRDANIRVGGQELTLRISSLPRFDSRYVANDGLLFGLVGLAMTGLLSWALWLVGRTRRRALTLAERMSAAARDRERRIDTIFNNTVEAIITTDRNGSVRSFNRTAQRATGYTEEEIYGRNIGLLVAGDNVTIDEPRIRELMAVREKASGPDLIEFVCRDRYGREFPVEASVREYDGEGETLFVCLARDISWRKRQEAEKAAIQQRLQLALDAGGFGVWLLWPEGQRLEWDDNTCRLNGVSPGSAPDDFGQWVKLVHPDDREGVLQGMDRLFAGEGFAPEAFRVFWPDGSVHYQLANLRLVCDGADRYVIGVVQDVTAQKQLEQSLRASEERLALTIDCAGLGTWAWELATGRVEYGGRWGEMLGYELQEMPQEIGSWERLVHPEDYPRVLEEHQAHWRMEVPVYAAEYRMRTRSGDWRWIKGVGRVVARDSEGEPLRMLGMNIDIDEHKRNEAALQESRQLAEAANRAKSEFLANISHEIRTPLNAVLGFSSLLAQTPLDSQQADFLDSIYTAGDVLLTLINDLLDFSKIEAGRLDLEVIAFNVRASLEGALNIVAARAAAKGLRLVCQIEPDVPQRLVGDPSRLRQVLLNLLINAVKFTERGEVSVSARALGEQAECVRLRVEVRDSGIGIPAEVQTRLFSPFTQADASTTRRFGGTGLGLSICRRLIEAMGGGIGVCSKPGEGSTFWFEAVFGIAPPVAEISPPAIVLQKPAGDEPGVRAPRGKLRVLLAEDNPVNQKVAALMLEGMGCEVGIAANGVAAVAAVDEGDYDLVLMDCQMPEMDGFMATERIRALPGARGRVPVIAVTANVFQADADRCYSVGMNDFITKPVTPERLRQVLLRWLPDSLVAGVASSVPRAAAAGGEEKSEDRDSLMADIANVQQVFAELRKNLGMDVRDELLALYFPTQSDCLQQLAAALSREDAPAVRHWAHKLKGSAAQLGAKHLSAMCLEIERACGMADIAGARARVAALEALAEGLRQALEVRVV